MKNFLKIFDHVIIIPTNKGENILTLYKLKSKTILTPLLKLKKNNLLHFVNERKIIYGKQHGYIIIELELSRESEVPPCLENLIDKHKTELEWEILEIIEIIPI